MSQTIGYAKVTRVDVRSGVGVRTYLHAPIFKADRINQSRPYQMGHVERVRQKI
jgi:hypothetical protein